MLATHRARMAARRGPELEPPPAFRLEDWIAADANRHDMTGKTAKALLRSLPPVWAGIIRRAALGELAGECVRSWDSERARGIVTLGYALCSNACATRRKGRRVHLVRGFTRGAFATLCSGDRGRKLHVNTIRGEHRKGAADESGQLGYLDALQRAGMFGSSRRPGQQLRGAAALAAHVHPFERWTIQRRPKGGGEPEPFVVTASRYWLVNPNPFDGHLTQEMRTALLELAETGLSSAALRLRPRARPASRRAPAPAEPAPPDS